MFLIEKKDSNLNVLIPPKIYAIATRTSSINIDKNSPENNTGTGIIKNVSIKINVNA